MGASTRASQSYVLRTRSISGVKGKLTTHLIPVGNPELPQKNAQKGNDHGEDEDGEAE